MDISVVIPVYKARKCIRELHGRLRNSLVPMAKEFEIIYVDDKCPEGTWDLIQEIASADASVKGVRLSRNFGQHQAISAGLEISTGQYIVVMDCDLQDDPKCIPDLYKEVGSGFDVVLAKWVSKDEPLLKRMSSRAFYMILNALCDTSISDDAGHFGIYSRKVIDAIVRFRDHTRWLKGMVGWAGFSVGYLEVKRNKRLDGKSSYSVKKLLNFASEIIILTSNRPLKILAVLGLAILSVSLVFVLGVVLRYFFGQGSLLGWPSLIVSIWFFSGLIIFAIGILGLYMGRIYFEVRGRPSYIVNEKTYVP